MEKIHVVLASPSDLGEEREMIKRLVDSINTIYEKHNIHFDLRMWEDSSPGISDEGPQGVIDEDLEIEKSDIFLCLYWKRVGTVLLTEGVAGTEHELNTAIKSYRDRKRPDIKVFFKETDDCQEETDKHISEIAARLKPQSLYKTFSGVVDLKDALTKIFHETAADRLTKAIRVNTRTENVITAASSKELLVNIKSGNTVFLDKGFYDVLEAVENPNIQYESVYDGEELLIDGIDNFSLIGHESGLLARPRYATVLTFRNCKNIRLSGLVVGHVPEKAYCAGTVVTFDNCKNIQIESTSLFGCGTYGLVLLNCENTLVNGTQIFECSYGGIIIDHSSLVLQNSIIHDCKGLASSLIEVIDGRLRMENVSIRDCSSDGYAVRICSDSEGNSSVFCDGVNFFNNTFLDISNGYRLGWGVFEKDNILTNAQ